MTTANSNLFTTKRAARRDASYDPGNESNSFAKIARRSTQLPLPVRDDDTISVLEPGLVNVVTKPRIERIEVVSPGESTSDNSDNFNYSSIVLQNVEELYWDPLGELSNFRVGELSASAKFSVNIRTESHEEVLPIDMHVLEFESPGKVFKIILKDTEGLTEYLKQTPIEQLPARVCLLQDVSIHASPIVSQLLGCSIDVFRDHFKRASDDVAFLLPSRSCIQDHVVIPYQRCYRRSSAKSICEVQNKRSTFCHGNLVSSEEHVTIWTTRSGKESLTLTWAYFLHIGDGGANAFSKENVSLVALGLASNEWQTVIRAQEAYMLPGLKPQYLTITEVRLSEKESFEEYLKQTWSILNMNLRVIDSLDHWLGGDNSKILKDYQFLENKVMIQMKQNSASIPLLTAMIAVEESRKAVQQANDVKALTVLATVYIPLSFVAGVFGMNVSELNSGIDVDIWLSFAISIPVTIASMVLVWKWEWLTRKIQNFRIRPNNSSPRKPVSGALFSVGRMTAGIGKPRDVKIGHDLEK
ncbi:hypothetical protein BGAL_0106g00250 [Botrytis galanthina]|uniref:Uncharacterized protein n=1 Tax=Botrytis galanthina TaxID=278940 RepID=A0A4S8R5U7_9HELO|nr:hypothetical protein BGAL_0106g00250 [Botrytis galanthina]